MNLDRGNIGADCGNPMKLERNRGHSGDYCVNINWDLLCHKHCLFRDWVRVRSRHDWWCAKDCKPQELCNGFN